MNNILALRYAIIKLKSEKKKMERIHKIFAGPMGIIPKVRNTIREKNYIRKCHVNSLARMDLACVLREGLMSCMYNIS